MFRAVITVSKRKLVAAGGALTLVIFLAIIIWSSWRELDILIVNGAIADGASETLASGDVAVRDGKIVGISRWRYLFARAKLRLDARGRVVAPGFIDVHTHIEANLPAAGPFRAPNFLRQGVTTLITGNCGRSRIDVAALFRALEKNGSYVNVATLVGHNSVRREALGEEARAPSSAELARMRQLVDRAMEDGALGLSSGLVYSPGRFARREELVALAKAAADGGGFYVSHVRDEGRGGIAAVREAVEIGREANAATHISHFKSSGPAQWNSMAERLRLLDEARASGQSVTIDVYPYDRSSTTTDVLLPDWAIENRRAGLKRAAQDKEARRRLREEILKKLRQDGWPDLKHLRLAAGQPAWIGKTLAEVPNQANELNGQIENLIEVSLRGGAQAIYADMRETDVEQAAIYPHSVFGSDSAVRDPDWLYKPHPRGAGTFPRIFRLYVREKPLIGIGRAVRKATGQAAEIFGLAGRGVLRPGAWADIVIFDPARIEDQADYDRPFTEPTGIDYVIVNGSVAVDHGALTGAAPSGMALRKQKPSLLD